MAAAADSRDRRGRGKIDGSDESPLKRKCFIELGMNETISPKIRQMSANFNEAAVLHPESHHCPGGYDLERDDKASAGEVYVIFM